MKTYLKVTFSSEGAKPSEVINRLRSLGFKPVIGGEQDMVYEWGGENATAEDSIWFADKIQATLEGFKVMFQIETLND
ncbi:hypothetical protein [Thermogymnomonas acidicola]|uniref:hypothetical protein n=1 Tax=Thermogymnomonas acidicola TaxID=399579 RepID=UPI0009466E9C|nr:hypothetical protein [Thermogymnomonas acidicola]